MAGSSWKEESEPRLRQERNCCDGEAPRSLLSSAFIAAPSGAHATFSSFVEISQLSSPLIISRLSRSRMSSSEDQEDEELVFTAPSS